MTVRLGPAGVADERGDRREIVERGCRFVGQHVSVTALRDAEFAQVAADARLRRVMAGLAEQADEILLAADRRPADDPAQRLAA
jgi:hypothetical protein